MHLIIKFNDNVYNVNTIKKHEKVESEHGSVIWGIIKPKPNSVAMGQKRIDRINNQINNGIETYAFMASGGKIVGGANILRILDNNQVKNSKELVPTYYHKDLDRCVIGLQLEKIRDTNPDIINELKRFDNPSKNVNLKNQTNPLYVVFDKEYSTDNVYASIIEESDENYDYELTTREKVEKIKSFILTEGFIYPAGFIENFFLALKTKPFVILAGISGTGKTKLAIKFGEAIGATIENGQMNIIPVRPDWSDSSDLIGYKNIKGEFIVGPLLEIMKEANLNKEKVYLVCLDEMNLARVEYYFSDLLSVIETRFWRFKKITSNLILSDEFTRALKSNEYKNIVFPNNLFIIGTVNMDETTHPFSKKVLDRANTIEFTDIDLTILPVNNTKTGKTHFSVAEISPDYLTLKDAFTDDNEQIIKKTVRILVEINNILEKANLHVGYRVRDEICFYMINNDRYSLLTYNQALDFQINQKILPRIQGSDEDIYNVLKELFDYLCKKNIANENGDVRTIISNIVKNNNLEYHCSSRKIAFMLRRFELDGFTSYWV